MKKQKSVTVKDLITDVISKMDPYYGSYVLDLKSCRWTLSYIRQELRRMGYGSTHSAKNSRWLFVYPKKEAK